MSPAHQSGRTGDWEVKPSWTVGPEAAPPSEAPPPAAVLPACLDTGVVLGGHCTEPRHQTPGRARGHAGESSATWWPEESGVRWAAPGKVRRWASASAPRYQAELTPSLAGRWGTLGVPIPSVPGPQVDSPTGQPGDLSACPRRGLEPPCQPAAPATPHLLCTARPLSACGTGARVTRVPWRSPRRRWGHGLPSCCVAAKSGTPGPTRLPRLRLCPGSRCSSAP